MTHSYCIVRYKGTIYRVPKVLFETEERAQDRAWYIANNMQDLTKNWNGNHSKTDKTMYELFNESHIYANKKYFQMEY